MKIPEKKVMASFLQLQHWNRLLYEKGLITQQEYLQIAHKIRLKYPVD